MNMKTLPKFNELTFTHVHSTLRHVEETDIAAFNDLTSGRVKVFKDRFSTTPDRVFQSVSEFLIYISLGSFHSYQSVQLLPIVCQPDTKDS